MRLIMTLWILLIAGCGTLYRDTARPITATTDFDVTRYLGTWYEIARYPVPFQRGCTATQAVYGAVDTDTISVLNSCRKGSPEGPLRQISGTADLVGPGQLRVQFDRIPLIKAPYWVLWVDETYTTAVVGVPNGRAGWILARGVGITPETRAEAEAVLRDNGYDPGALIDVAH